MACLALDCLPLAVLSAPAPTLRPRWQLTPPRLLSKRSGDDNNGLMIGGGVLLAVGVTCLAVGLGVGLSSTPMNVPALVVAGLGGAATLGGVVMLAVGGLASMAGGLGYQRPFPFVSWTPREGGTLQVGFTLTL